jgi:hypothetical protein
MDEKKTPAPNVKISGIGTHKIDVDMLDDSVRERVIECIKKNGKISIELGAGLAAAAGTKGFEQLID